MNKLLVLIVLLTTLYSNTIIGIGENKKDSLSDLSNQISVEVKSEFKTFQELKGKHIVNTKQKFVYLISNLPIKGVKFEDNEKKAILNENSIVAYKTELNRLKKNIEVLKNKKDYRSLLLLLEDIESFNKNKIVALTLGARNLPKIDVTIAQVHIRINSLEKNAPSIDVLAKYLSKGIKQKNIYIVPIKTKNSQDITQFSKILKDTMSTYLNITDNSMHSKYILRGNYKILKNSLFIILYLYDENNNIIKTKIGKIKKSALNGISYKVQNVDFDKIEISSKNYVDDTKLRVKLRINNHLNNVDSQDFNEGDEIGIFVRSNMPICYYLIGYTLHKNQKFSYLFPFDDEGKQFVNRLTKTNQMVKIADGEISEPFGRESFQIVAQTLKNGKCELKVPECHYEGDYCVVSKQPIHTLIQTRSIKHKANKIQIADDIVNFVTFKK